MNYVPKPSDVPPVTQANLYLIFAIFPTPVRWRRSIQNTSTMTAVLVSVTSHLTLSPTTKEHFVLYSVVLKRLNVGFIQINKPSLIAPPSDHENKKTRHNNHIVAL